MKQSAYFHYRIPRYHYPCFGFLYATDPNFYVMDDFGNAVISLVEIDIDLCCIDTNHLDQAAQKETD